MKNLKLNYLRPSDRKCDGCKIDFPPGNELCSFPRSGNKTKRGVEFRRLQHTMSHKSG